MTAFARAAAVLHRDRHMSVPVSITFTARAGRTVPSAPVECTGIPSQPEEPAAGQGNFGQMTRRTAVSIALADLPIPPEKGDAITMGGTAYAATRVDIDAEQTSATIILARS
jgi:hypothetical protein